MFFEFTQSLFKILTMFFFKNLHVKIDFIIKLIATIIKAEAKLKNVTYNFCNAHI